ncbi:MAG TPA: ExeM/NucH family extracellular endonuclease [Polyangiaceae bacterium]|nr:ExeM/NucH family extracellular endonuclease [Polyangiaceae bacterium]
MKQTLPWLRGLVGAVVLLLTESSYAQVVVSALGSPVTQDFDTLASSGTSGSTPTGWTFLETGTNADATYAAGTGSATAGNSYSFGAGAASDRAFGTLLSGSLTPTIGAEFVNSTGSAISNLAIAYTGEQWRLGTSGRQDRLDFQYSLDATSLGTGNWVNVDALDFSTPSSGGAVGATNGNGTGFKTALSASISGISIAVGAHFWIRWSDFNASGADDGLGIDDFSLTATLSDLAPSVLSTLPVNGAVNVGLGATLEVTFNEPVSVSPDWADVTCMSSGIHVLTTSGGPTHFTLTSSAAFSPGEQCVLSIFASEVSDQDPPPTMPSSDVFVSFTTDATSGCGVAATPIHDVEGSSSASPLVGSTVTIEGVVVGDFQGSTGLSGFFVQEEDSQIDDNPLTSEAIFVFDGAGAVAVHSGDVVRVTGQVREYFNLTELSGPTSVNVCAAGASVTPSEVVLPAPDATYLERFEGMLVDFAQPLTASDTYNLGRYGEVTLSSGGRLQVSTHVAAPGAPANAVEEANLRRSVQLDDGSNIENPATSPYLAPDGTLRVGDTVTGLRGVLGYAFDVYEIHPTQAPTFQRDNPRPALPAAGSGLRIASFNVLNYFTTLDTGSPVCGPLHTLDCRGANSAAEFQRQRTKILAAMTTINADIYGLMELENNTDASLTDLVSGLNGIFGSGTYDFVHTGTIGTDAIKVGLIYKTSTVTLESPSYAILDSTYDPSFIDTRNRPVLAQTFRQLATGEVITIAVNHLKSKGSACTGDPDVGDGQGNCNQTRTAAALAELGWLDTHPTGSSDSDVLVMGDMNAYAKEDPIAAFIGGGLVDLMATRIGGSAYSYVFNGESGYLDHALASPSLAAKVSSVTEWHINADEPRILDYNQEFNPPALYQPDAFRASDHDPFVIDIGTPVATPMPKHSAAWLALGLLVLGGTVVSVRRFRR